MGRGEGGVLCLGGSSRSFVRGGLGGREAGCSTVRAGAGAMVLTRPLVSMHEGIRERHAVIHSVSYSVSVHYG